VLINYQSVKNIVEAQFGPGIHFHRISYCPETAFLRSTDTPVPPVSAGIQSLQPADAPLLMSVSRHDPRKGLDVFIRALALLRGKGIPFRASLVGTGSLESSHRKLVEELGLSDSVRIEGLVPDSFDFLRHADVFVLPSLEEGSGSVSLLEALQVGVAVVASNTDGIPEDVSHGDSALLVEPGNAVNLAAALEQLLCNPELRHRMARRSMEIFEEKFSAATLTRALTAFYGSLGFPPDVNPHPSTASVGFQL
jgi:glycosyltransferase involved in cell wall biosynthesis